MDVLSFTNEIDTIVIPCVFNWALSFRSFFLHLQHLINVILIFSLKHAPTQQQKITKTIVVTTKAISPEVHSELKQSFILLNNPPTPRRACTLEIYNIRNIDSIYKALFVAMVLSLFNKLLRTFGFVSKEQKKKNLYHTRLY